jgi:hypothetical protein
MKRAIVHDVGDGVILETPFVADFVDDLKAEISARKRRWDPARKAWWVAASAIDQALDITRRYYTVEFAEEADEPAPYPRSESVNAWAALWLVPGAPPEVVAAAYRAMAKLHHPDHGGDNAAMQRVNAAYEEITSSR